MMPSLPLLARETTNIGCSWSQSRSADQMCRQQCRGPLTAEKAIAAEESLTVYCKPVEFYNILQRRAIRNPSFLQRCLHYKIQARRKRRIQITLSLSENSNAGIVMQNMFPLYVMLARPVADMAATKSAVYRVNQMCILTSISESGMKYQSEAEFVIPDAGKLSTDGQISNLTIILASSGGASGTSGGNGLPGEHDEHGPFQSILGGNCFWGKISIESLCSSLEKCVAWVLDRKIEMTSKTDMNCSVLKPTLLDNDSCLAFETHNIVSKSSFQLQVTICAREAGGREKSPYDSFTFDNIPASSLPHIIRLRTGNVLFNYKYYNNTMQQTEGFELLKIHQYPSIQELQT